MFMLDIAMQGRVEIWKSNAGPLILGVSTWWPPNSKWFSPERCAGSCIHQTLYKRMFGTWSRKISRTVAEDCISHCQPLLHILGQCNDTKFLEQTGGPSSWIYEVPRLTWFEVRFEFLFTPKPVIIKNPKKKRNLILCEKCWVSLRYQAALLGSLATIELLTLEHGRVMSAEACTEFRRSYLVYRGALNWLANENLEKRKCRFHLRPKVHQLAHICWDFLPLNPRRYSNYLDEDFIFKTKKVAERVHPLHMPMHVCMRYSIAVCLRWSDGALWKWCEKTCGVKNREKQNEHARLYTICFLNVPFVHVFLG